MNMLRLMPLLYALAPPGLMLLAALSSFAGWRTPGSHWKQFNVLSAFALLPAAITAALQFFSPHAVWNPLADWLAVGPFGACMALLVQLLAIVIGAFSGRYLDAEQGQSRYIAALAAVLAAVHALLLANHWVVLIVSWSLTGSALQHLLCFYRDRPFAMLAAHKKRIADTLANALLLCAAALAWRTVGSGSFSALWQHLVHENGGSWPLQISAVCLVLAVVLRTALLPVHGWLIQVMESPTPVSALLHAGVVNLGGYVLIRFAPLLDHATAAHWLLVVFGLATALLAGLVVLTRTSVKVRLAWSTVAQMGFMLLECGLGLYAMAALHLVGHSLYKAHAFLSTSTVVGDSRLQAMHGQSPLSKSSLMIAPPLAVSSVALVQLCVPHTAWPWWWSGVLALAWAPLFWVQASPEGDAWAVLRSSVAAWGMAAGLTGIASIAHALPLGIHDAPNEPAGALALAGMVAMYLCLVILQVRPGWLHAWRRWSYAGFYIDEFNTRLALRYWPTRWVPAAANRIDQRTMTRPVVTMTAE
ncbi:NADH-quinone oxidoreductase subunit L [Paraburkholderia sp. SUR17]|uniref:NADH-quinone oxidoreductase subunit L n=1 Tax=Paraburkholderia sp. SUR17 TaxID=3034358 RepID=UPI0024082570|nr:NADH-quinone oxidoreductase subunit L [Paraburkholderia sp. SUR17]WEY40533.1 NADH-quinone oxidoreductase subunit L [Paraburkholderia sp. SUR17]